MLAEHEESVARLDTGLPPTPRRTMTKHCNRCDTTKLLDEFHRSSRNRDGRQSYCKGCQVAAVRILRNGHPEPLANPNVRTGSDNGRYIDGRFAYQVAHRKVARERGRAAEHLCSDCGGQADHWAFSHSAPNAQRSPNGMPFCDDPKHYQPMCTGCHKRLDNAHRELFELWDRWLSTFHPHHGDHHAV